MIETIIIKKAVDLLSGAIGTLFKKNRLMAAEKESGRLIAEAIRELLSTDPNLNKVRTKLRLAEQAWPKPTEDLLNAQEMLNKVAASRKKKTAKSRRKTARRKTAKRK